MAKNIQDRPVNYKDWSQAELATEAGRVGIALADGASKRQIADALNGTAPSASTEEAASNAPQADGTDEPQVIVDAADMSTGTVLEHKDRSGTVLSSVAKQADGRWLLSTDGQLYTSLSKAAVADHKSRGGQTTSINGRAYYGLPSAAGTPRGASTVGLPRGKSRDALVARRDKIAEMIKDLNGKLADAEKAIEAFDIEHANESEVKQALAEFEAAQKAALDAKKAEILAAIAAKKAAAQ